MIVFYSNFGIRDREKLCLISSVRKRKSLEGERGEGKVELVRC